MRMSKNLRRQRRCDLRIIFTACVAGVGGFSALADAESHPLGIPTLNSRPGAAYTVYLDFGGFSFFGNWGNGSGVPGTTPAFDHVTNAFSGNDVSYINQIWSRVAEKYSAFNINVTTVDPAAAANQASTDASRQLFYDQTPRLMHTVIGDGTWTGGGGVSYVGVTQGSFGSDPNVNGGHGIGYHTNWLFTNSLGGPGDVSAIAEAGAHENGHGLGLNHQSDVTGSTITNEYSGTTARPATGRSRRSWACLITRSAGCGGRARLTPAVSFSRTTCR